MRPSRKTPATTIPALLAALLAAALLGSCGAPKEGEGKSPTGGGAPAAEASRTDGGISPRECFENFKQYPAEGRVAGAMLGWIAPDLRPGMVLGLYMGLKYDAMENEQLKMELETFHIENKVPDIAEFTEGMSDQDLADAAKLDAVAKKMFEGKNLAAITDMLLAIAGNHGDGPKKPDKAPATLTKVEIAGDEAVGVVEYDDGSTEEARFVKVGGRWFIIPGN